MPTPAKLGNASIIDDRRVDGAAVASTNVFVYNRRSEIVETTMRNGGSLYDYDW